jgi:hopanoid biosynthesis associated protein HpnK
MKRVIITADDFGLSEAVNAAVEEAHRRGVLTSASLMVNAPASADAVRRARALPDLAVGLHLVLVDGPAVLPHAAIPGLVDEAGRFGADQARRGVAYFFCPLLRRQLAAEIAAQFSAFAATGLALDHADAHKHMHLHPTVARLMIDIGRPFGLRALRVPAEPPAVLARCGARPGLAARALYHWSAGLRRRARRAGMRVNDYAFGIHWSGHMTGARLIALARHLPEGVSEIYTHPATRAEPALAALMPDYEHGAEYAGLCDPALRDALRAAGAIRTTYGAAW